MTVLYPPIPRPQLKPALFLCAAMAATVGGALAFQHLGGYIPCHLCLEQRIPYYVGVPLMALAALSALSRMPRWVTRSLLALGGILMLVGFGMGVYHAGVEWGFWAGPADCTAVGGSVDTGGKGVLDAIDAVVPPSCDKAALTIAGLSLAGWNAVISLLLAAVAFWGASRRA